MERLKDFFLKHTFELSGAGLLFFVVLMNLFPQGYIFLGGDVIQPIEMVDNFSFYYYEWQGRVSLYYGIFYLLDALKISESTQLSWYLGIFLIGSYVSFLVFCSLVFPRVASVTRVLMALFYATNVYTLYIFTASWGYTSYPILYCFIPLLTGLYIYTIESGKWMSVYFFILTAFFTSSSFGNPAFALSLGIYFVILTTLLWVVGVIKQKEKIPVKMAVLFFGAFMVNFFWILPLVPQVKSGVQEVASSTDLNLAEALYKTSNAIFDTMRLLPTSEQSRYFPANFPYPSISWLEDVLMLLAFIPFLIIIFLYIKKKMGREFRLYIVFLGILLVFVFLVARVRYPFETINMFLFQLPGLNVLRGFDKTATFLPFLMSVLLLIAVASLEKKRYYKILVSGLFFMILLLTFPFYAGDLQTRLSYILYNQKNKSFQDAKQSALVKIPESYYGVATIFEQDNEVYKLSMLPFSPGSSVGRVSLPLWKVNGPHVARYIYHRPFLELTERYLPGWKFAEEFVTSEQDPRWITDLYGLLNVKYIFYHKDAKEDRIEKMEPIRQRLIEIGAIVPVEENHSFILYRINRDNFFPYVYASNVSRAEIPFNTAGLSEGIETLREHSIFPNFSYLNPKKISLKTDQLSDYPLVFINEKYDPLWRAEYVSYQGDRVLLERDDSVKYANAWKTPSQMNQGEILIYYFPDFLFTMSLWVTVLTLVAVGVGISFEVRRSKY